MFVRHASDHPPKILEQQPENGLALAQVPTQSLRLVVEDGAGNAAFKAASRSMIQFLH